MLEAGMCFTDGRMGDAIAGLGGKEAVAMMKEHKQSSLFVFEDNSTTVNLDISPTWEML